MTTPPSSGTGSATGPSDLGPADEQASHPELDRMLAGPVLGRLLTFLERTSDLVGVTDANGSIVYLNPAARMRLGIREDESSITTDDLFPPAAFDIYFDQIRPRIIGGDIWAGYLPIRGAVEPIEMWATIVGETSPGGEVDWLVLAARDVNDWHHMPDAVHRHAAFDELTGLATRSLLMDHLAKAQTRAARSGQAVAVAFIDLDDMKAVNHTFGNTVGDGVLVEVARRLRDAVRVIDIVARVGGDQFVVLFDGVADEDETTALVTQIQASLESASVAVGDRTINVSASIGTAVARDGELGHQLLGRADTAMYEVKADRRNRRGQPTRHVGADLRSVTLNDIAVAVTRDEIVPYYQRVVDIGGGTTRGFQALARWLRPDGSTVDASEFLAIADDSGVSFTLDLSILRHALGDLAGGNDLGRLYVPVSPRFLRRPGVDRFVHEVLARAGVAPDRLAVLVDERLVTARALVIGDALSALRDLGVHLVLDSRPPPADDDPASPSPSHRVRDDGTGALFGQLRLAPAWMAVLADDAAPLAARVARARDQGQEVLVGGVETDAQRLALRDLGCALVSGHLIGRPEPTPG